MARHLHGIRITGPILWAPFSALRGRRLLILIAAFGFTVFQFAIATAKDLQTIMLCRFLGGFFGACSIAVVAARLLRHLRQSHAWFGYYPLYNDRLHWAAVRVHRQWLYCAKPPGLALDRIPHRDYGRFSRGGGLLHV